MTKDEALKLAHEALKKFHYAMIDAGVLDRKEVLNEGFTAATAIKEALAQPEQDWRNAALRIGEDLSSVGPEGYYNMTAQQWLDWAMEQKPRGNNSLAQPEQEPVAYWKFNNGFSHCIIDQLNEAAKKNPAPLYTAPPQRIWVGLTKTEVVDLLCEYSKLTGNVGWQQLIYMTEAKLKQKNGYAEEKNT